jgi:hypothetical protein
MMRGHLARDLGGFEWGVNVEVIEGLVEVCLLMGFVDD